ncbi:MAG: radical SAM protein [Candidatus Thermoplasmatota archaeon]|nr:radical SAM protein [Candidatus Thermoplasmatota archaeon]
MNHSGLRYEGPIYRPPSEANSLLVQATVGCPHNRCTFCMVYKKGPKFRVRPVNEIKEDLLWAHRNLSDSVQTVFFPSGNTIVMKTDDLVEIFRYTQKLFPDIKRITIYGSSQYIVKKGLKDMKKIAQAGLSRIHVGLESGDDIVLKRVKKGSTKATQIKAGTIVKKAGIELSEYVILGLGGKERSKQHVKGTIDALNEIDPDFIRLRTFLPKINTPILDVIKTGNFVILSPHEILKETYDLIDGLHVQSTVMSDHYTNYIQIQGQLPMNKKRMLDDITLAMERDDSSFRRMYIGTA